MASTNTIGGAGHSLPFVFYFLAAVTSVLAHVEKAESMQGHGGTIDEAAFKNATEYPSTYFAHTKHVGTIYAHITLMVLAWVFVLPIGRPALSVSLPLPLHQTRANFAPLSCDAFNCEV